MKDTTYVCNVCKATYKADVVDGYMIGIHWIDFPDRGWQRRKPRDCENHICFSCIESIKKLDTTKMVAK